MGNGAIDYLSFVRGYLAATDDDAAGADPVREPDTPPNPHGPDTDGPAGAIEPDSYAEGIAAATEPVEHTLTYRELSLQDGGRFAGTLDLVDPPPTPVDGDAAPPDTGAPEPAGPTEHAGAGQPGPDGATEPPGGTGTPGPGEATEPETRTEPEEGTEPRGATEPVEAVGPEEALPAPSPDPDPVPSAGFRQTDFKQASLRALLKHYDTESLRAESNRLRQGHAPTGLGPADNSVTGDGDAPAESRVVTENRGAGDPDTEGPATGDATPDGPAFVEGTAGDDLPQRPSVSGTLDLD